MLLSNSLLSEDGVVTFFPIPLSFERRKYAKWSSSKYLSDHTLIGVLSLCIWADDEICKMKIQDWLIALHLTGCWILSPVPLKQFCHLIKFSRALRGPVSRTDSLPRTYPEFIPHWEEELQKHDPPSLAHQSAQWRVVSSTKSGQKTCK